MKIYAGIGYRELPSSKIFLNLGIHMELYRMIRWHHIRRLVVVRCCPIQQGDWRCSTGKISFRTRFWLNCELQDSLTQKWSAGIEWRLLSHLELIELYRLVEFLSESSDIGDHSWWNKIDIVSQFMNFAPVSVENGVPRHSGKSKEQTTLLKLWCQLRSRHSLLRRRRRQFLR